MPRIRTIKPEFWTDSRIVCLSRDARLFFIGLWNYADDNGVLNLDVLEFKLRIFPNDTDIKNDDIVNYINELIDIGLVLAYESTCSKYIIIKNFTKHQVIDRPRKSNLPKPDDEQIHELGNIQGNQLKSTEISPGREGKGREGKGNIYNARTDENTNPDTPPLPPPLAVPKSGNGRVCYSKDFETFFASYPRKTAKARAYKAWTQAKKSKNLPSVDVILDAIEAQNTWPQWQAGYIPHPATWLNGHQWLDERPPDTNRNGEDVPQWKKLISP